MQDNSFVNDKEQFQARSVELPEKKKKSKKGFLIFLCIFIGIILIGVLCKSLFGNDKVISSQPYIGTIYVEGTIAQGQTNSFGVPIGYQHQWTLDQIDTLIGDKSNRGLIVFVNSPGGGVYESDELYFKLKEYKEKTNRPVYSVMGSMAASGGYYISAPADKIIANRNTWTGSIGVTIGTIYDISGLLNKYGVKWKTITSGKNKAMGSMVEPMTPEQQEIFQSMIDEAYEQFIGIVSKERKINLDEMRKIADGRIYTAKQALNLHLVDQIGTMDDAVKDMKQEYKLGNCDVIDLIYKDDSFWGSVLSSKTADKLFNLNNFGKGDVSAIMNVVNESKQTPVSYLCESLKNY